MNKNLILLIVVIMISTISYAQSWHELNNQVITFYNKGNYYQAIGLAEKSLKLAEKEFGKTHENYLHSLTNLAELYRSVGQFENALPLYLEAKENAINVFGKDHAAYGVFLNNLAVFYSNMGQYDKALPLLQESLENTKNALGKDHSGYGIKLNNLAELNRTIGNYDQAITLYQEAIENVKKTLGTHDSAYSTYLNNFTLLYIDMGQYDKALTTVLEALESTKENLGSDHPNYGNSLGILAELYRIMGQYNKALPLYHESLKNIKNTLGEHHPNYANCISNLAILYENMGQYDQALPLYQETLENTKNNLGENHPDYGVNLYNLAGIYATLGQYRIAMPLYLEALENIKNTLGINHYFHSNCLNGLASLYESLGQFDKALPLYLELLESFENNLGKDQSDYGMYLNNLAVLYRRMGQYDKALHIYQEAIENIKNNFGIDHEYYGTRLNNLAELYTILGQYEKALPLYIEALTNKEIALGKDHSSYGTSLNNLASLYEKIGQNEKALVLYLEALNNSEKTLSKDHPEYAIRLNNLALFYESTGHFDKALHLYLKALENIYGQLNQSFSFMSENEKVKFLITVESDFQVYLNFLTRYSLTQLEVTTYAYDIELATKGMILKSGTQMRKTMLHAEQANVVAKFDEWNVLKSILAQQYGQPISERRSDINNVEKQAEQLEAELTRISSAFSALEKSKISTWQDVKAALGHEEVAIEFASFPYRSTKEWTDSILYVALLLRPEDTYPLMIPLFEERQLTNLLYKESGRESARVNYIYDGTQLYSLIWKSLEKYLKPKDNIYFSPSGFLNQINFSAIRDTDSTYLSDKYNFNQLRSTSDICQKTNDFIGFKNLILFGGMDFEATEENISKALQNIPKNEDYVSRGLVIHDSTRYGKWTYLPGTKKEAENIYKISTNANITSKIFTGAEALEEQFKSLDGEKSPSILHLATHGFFFPDPKISKGKLGMMSFQRDNTFSMADNPMNRSGLLFSGSNKAWIGDSISVSREDGILTAYEASHTYLKNTELVVLSACETGLGDIKGSEGVYGLQRAFKMAGARYLLMSLWKVPDNATQEFMTTFYTELLTNKHPIRSAYKMAQNAMKAKYRNEPYKWAGFVLME